jgi:hypothetical protein
MCECCQSKTKIWIVSVRSCNMCPISNHEKEKNKISKCYVERDFTESLVNWEQQERDNVVRFVQDWMIYCMEKSAEFSLDFSLEMRIFEHNHDSE